MDIALLFTPGSTQADIALDGADLQVDNDLKTAVIMSLFTDRRANNDDIVEGSDRRGWWADTYNEIAKDKIGSRLWLLSRSKQTQDTLNLARGYCVEALQWLIDDRVAQQVNVNVEIVRMGVLGIAVEVIKPSSKLPAGEVNNFRFDYVWSQF